MMGDTWQNLRQALAAEQEALVRGYVALIAAIEEGDLGCARLAALRLDRQAGPHVEFEERFLYPLVEEDRGEAFAVQLYDEHNAALQTLLEVLAAERLEAEGRDRWLQGMRQGLQHATACDALLVYLRQLEETQQIRLLERLYALRQLGRRWSQLHPRNGQHGEAGDA